MKGISLIKCTAPKPSVCDKNTALLFTVLVKGQGAIIGLPKACFFFFVFDVFLFIFTFSFNEMYTCCVNCELLVSNACNNKQVAKNCL